MELPERSSEIWVSGEDFAPMDSLVEVNETDGNRLPNWPIIARMLLDVREKSRRFGAVHNVRRNLTRRVVKLPDCTW